MATFQNTSGTSDFTETRDAIITRALRICSAIADEEIATNSMIANGSEALNALIKQWDALGIHLWTETEGVLFLQPNQAQYSLNPRVLDDHATEKWILSSVYTALGPTATIVTLGDVFFYGQTDFVIGDKIGIVLDSGTVFWSKIAYANTSGTNVIITLADPLSGSASNNSMVFIYRFELQQPLRVVSSRRFILENRIDTPLLTMSRIDYREMPNKETPGTVTSFFYDPQMFTGYYYVWPTPSDVSAIVRFTWYRRLQDLNDPNDIPDLPQEWANCITWNLAKEIAAEYDVPIQKYQGIIMPRAAETLDMVQGWDRESESIYFGLAETPSSR